MAAMCYSWLDHWDERRTLRRGHEKKVTGLELGTELAFPSVNTPSGVEEFYGLSAQAVSDSHSFFKLTGSIPELNWDHEWLTFPSTVSTETVENNTVHAKMTTAKSSDHALVVFHHWNATSRSPSLARFFAWQGYNVFEIAMPYHLERERPGSTHADYILSPNLGRTVRSIRQAVLDGRQLIRILQGNGYEKVSVLGISLGSWVAGLVAAHDPLVTQATLFLTAGSLADMVWTGSATQHIRASLESSIGLPELHQAWAPLSLNKHADKLSRPGLKLQMILAQRDRVVLPTLSKQLIAQIENAGGKPRIKWLNCGHYSLSLPPYILSAGLSASRFLNA